MSSEGGILSDIGQPSTSDRPLPGAKRNAANFLSPLPPSSASKRRLTRQRSDSCISGLSAVSGPGAGQIPGAGAQGATLTPTSKALAEVSSSIDMSLVSLTKEELQVSYECSMADAVSARSSDPAVRSPSVTNVTFQSTNSRNYLNSRVNCEEELDDEEDEVRGCAESEATCDMVPDHLPQWNPPVELLCHSPAPQQALLEPILDPSAQGGSDPGTSSTTNLEQCGTYEEDIFQNLRQHEISRKPSWGYLETNQKDLIIDHRRIMVNWLVEFAEEFGLEPETLFLCVAILDQFLLRGPSVKKGSLQLLGTACMLIAVKFQETHPPNMIQSCCAAAEGSFTQEQVVAMEALVLKTIGYNCSIPTAQTFLWHHLKEVSRDLRLEKMSEYLAMLSLCEYNLLRYYPSALSAASVLLGGVMLGRDAVHHLRNMRCEYSFNELKPIMRVLFDLHQQSSANSHLSSIQRKFLSEENLAVAAFPAPPVSFLPDRRNASK